MSLNYVLIFRYVGLLMDFAFAWIYILSGRCNILWNCVLVWGPCAIALNVLLHFRRLWPIAIENRFQSFYYSVIHWLRKWILDFLFAAVFTIFSCFRRSVFGQTGAPNWAQFRYTVDSNWGQFSINLSAACRGYFSDQSNGMERT